MTFNNTTSHYIYVPNRAFFVATVHRRVQLPTGNNNNTVLIHEHKAGGGTKQNSLNYP